MKSIPLFVFASALVFQIACSRPLPVMGEVPDFSLTRETGETVSRKDLEGRVWVANFIYGGCAEACPMLSLQMGELQKKSGQFPDPPNLVSFTVDPGADTPERLRDYARRYGAEPERWMFLTGDAEAVRSTLSRGFKVSAVEAPAQGPTDGRVRKDIFHSNKVALVDRHGRIRGYYDTDPEGMGALIKAVGRLGKEK